MKWQERKILREAVATALLMVSLVPVAVGADYKVLHRFKGPYHDATRPASRLLFDSAGNLYGTALQGGNFQKGAVFKLTPQPAGNWVESVIYSFSAKHGIYPASELVMDTAGNLYGTTQASGRQGHGLGLVFKLAPNPDGSWTETVLHHFDGADGALPESGLIFDSAGDLYGTTLQGGQFGNNGSTVFKLAHNPDGGWKESVIYSFGPGPGGYFLTSNLVFDQNGNLYGVAALGGINSLGVVFELSPNPDGSWTENVLHSFSGASDGCYPYGRLTLSGSDKIYGTTMGGCGGTFGTIFELVLNPDGTWSENVIRNFKGQPGPSMPYSGVILDSDGNVYGTSLSGGGSDACPGGCGTIFKLAKNPDGSWTPSKLHSFHDTDGSFPIGGLVADEGGALYGTTERGGKAGVVFRLIP